MNSSKNRIPRLAAALLAAALCTTLTAQVTPTPTMTPDQPVGDTAKDGTTSHHDRGFMKKAAAGGMKEIDISRAVQDRLSNTQLRDFAQMMVTDHTAANAELMTLAASKGVKLPDEDMSVGKDWAAKTGDIDSKYAKAMVSDHEETVKLFEKAAKSTDADVAAFAQKTLPTLQHHLAVIQELAKTVN